MVKNLMQTSHKYRQPKMFTCHTDVVACLWVCIKNYESPCGDEVQMNSIRCVRIAFKRTNIKKNSPTFKSRLKENVP